jgi:hypothetical protein
MRPLLFATIVVAVVSSGLSTYGQQQCWNHIEFTLIPPTGEGSSSRGTIGGKLCGFKDPSNLMVVIYAHTDAWYVQPLILSPLTAVNEDGTWSNWTHLGQRYAALLVRPIYRPQSKIEELPDVGGDVVGRVEASPK